MLKEPSVGLRNFFPMIFWRIVAAAPDGVVDFFVKLSIKDRLRRERRKRKEDINFDKKRYEEMSLGPIALQTEEANQQHYEVPTQFFQYVLGKHLKYSSCYYEDAVLGNDRLSQAEEKMLALTVNRADLNNGQTVLELGCGWGSLSLYMARKYSKSTFFCVSNSKTQKEFIDSKASELALKNLHVICANINHFSPSKIQRISIQGKRKKKGERASKVQVPKIFDRIVSVEMFEHMRNYADLLANIKSWLRPRTGRLFVHIFTHKRYTYFFHDDEWAGASWMARNFFSAGVMPEFNIFSHFKQYVSVEKTWKVNGKNYSHTAHDWYLNHCKYKKEIIELFKNTYGGTPLAHARWFYWKLFFVACRELFGAYDGNEWLVGHYLLSGKSKISMRK